MLGYVNQFSQLSRSFGQKHWYPNNQRFLDFLKRVSNMSHVAISINKNSPHMIPRAAQKSAI